jgi:pre-mRNA-splicing helicase BRR2
LEIKEIFQVLFVFRQIGLFIVDDLHLLAAHGSTLEVVVSRMRFITTQMENQIRIVGLATSMANFKDVAEWIGATQVFNFHPNVRAVPLDVQITSFDQVNQNQRLLSMQKALYHSIKI